MGVTRTDAFFDTNVLLYLVSKDWGKGERAQTLVDEGGLISVQVLDEFASVATRKVRLHWDVVHGFLGALRRTLQITPTDLGTHELGLRLAERYRVSVYDSMLLAAALQAGCTTFYSEDLHDGQVIENALTIRNPFR